MYDYVTNATFFRLLKACLKIYELLKNTRTKMKCFLAYALEKT